MEEEKDQGPWIVSLMFAAYFAGLFVVDVGANALVWVWSVINV
jgi:hypothetical protein|tara:strand:- start:366 stop:494 length:129 start_codon:yes stop_codon:yes gene_type:complete